MRHYDAVFFDAANTLLYPFPSVGEIYAEVAGRYGVTTSGAAVQRAFGQAWSHTQTLAQRDPVRYGVGEPDGRRFWHTLVHAVFAQIALPEDFDRFFDPLDCFVFSYYFCDVKNRWAKLATDQHYPKWQLEFAGFYIFFSS